MDIRFWYPRPGIVQDDTARRRKTNRRPQKSGLSARGTLVSLWS